MNITLQPITNDNWIQCIELAPTAEQQRIGFVAPNQLSLAQAYVERWWQPYAIYAGDDMVGFVFYGRWPETGSPRITAKLTIRRQSNFRGRLTQNDSERRLSRPESILLSAAR